MPGVLEAIGRRRGASQLPPEPVTPSESVDSSEQEKPSSGGVLGALQRKQAAIAAPMNPRQKQMVAEMQTASAAQGYRAEAEREADPHGNAPKAPTLEQEAAIAKQRREMAQNKVLNELLNDAATRDKLQSLSGTYEGLKFRKALLTSPEYAERRQAIVSDPGFGPALAEQERKTADAQAAMAQVGKAGMVGGAVVGSAMLGGLPALAGYGASELGILAAEPAVKKLYATNHPNWAALVEFGVPTVTGLGIEAGAARALGSPALTRKAIQDGIRRGEILTPEGEARLAAGNAFEQALDEARMARPALPAVAENAAAREAQAIREVAAAEAARVAKEAELAQQRATFEPVMELRARMARLRAAFGVGEPIEAQVASEVAQTGVATGRAVSGAPEQAAETAIEGSPRLPRNLAGARPRYREQGVNFASDVDRALYIVAAPTKSKADGLYIEWLQKNFPGADEAALRLRGQQVRRAVREASRDFEETINLPETVKSGKQGFREKPPVLGEGKPNRALTSMAREQDAMKPPQTAETVPSSAPPPAPRIQAPEPPKPPRPEDVPVVMIPGVGDVDVPVASAGASSGRASAASGQPFRSMTEAEYTARAQARVDAGELDVRWATGLHDGAKLGREEAVGLRILHGQEVKRGEALVGAFNAASDAEKPAMRAALDEAVVNASKIRRRLKEATSEGAGITQAAARASRITGGSADAVPDIVKQAQQSIADRMKRLGTQTFDITGAAGEAAGAAKDFAIVGAWHLYRGARSFATWSAAMLKDFGEGIRPYLEEVFKDAQARMAADRLVEGGVPVLKKDLERILARGVKVPENVLDRFPDLRARAARLQLLEKGDPLDKLAALDGGVPETSIAEAAGERATAANIAEGANVSQANVADSMIVGKYYLDRGYRNYSEWAEQMRKAIPNMSEATMKKVWLASNSRLQAARLIAEEAAALDVDPLALTAERFLGVPDAEVIKQLTKRYEASIFDKIIHVATALKLTGLGNLLVKNPGSNLLMQLARVPHIEAQALIGSGLVALGGGASRWKPGAGLAYGKGVLGAMELSAKARAVFDTVSSLEGLRRANTAFLDALDNASRNPVGKMVDGAQDFKASFPVTYLESRAARIGKRAVSAPGALLELADRWTMTSNVAGEAAAELYSLTRRGLSPAEAAGSLKAFMASATPEQIARWEAAAKKLAFRQESGPFAQKLESLVNHSFGGKGGFRVLKLGVPFTRTMTNIAKIGWGLTPLRNLDELVHGLRAAGIGSEEMIRISRARYTGNNIARVGTDLMAANAGAFTLYMMYVNGAVTGPEAPYGSKDRSVQEALQNDGLWQPDSLHIGDTWISYRDLGPLSSAISATVGAFDAYNRGKANHKTPASVWTDAVSAQFKVVTENPYTGVLRDIAKAVDYRDANILQPIFSAIRGITVPPIVGNIAKMMDPVQRQAPGLLGSIQSRTPGLSDDLAPKVTGLGEELRIPTLQALGIPNVTTPGTKTLSGELAEQRITVPLPQSVGGEKLTPQAIVAIAKERGAILDPAIRKLMGTDWWQKADRIQRQAQVDRLSRRYLAVSKVYQDIKRQAAIQGLPVEQDAENQ